MHGLRLIWCRSPQLFPALASFRYRTALWTVLFTSLNRSCCVYLRTFVFTSSAPAIGALCEIAHLVCAVHCVLLRLSVSAVSGICLCFTGVPATHCLACGLFSERTQPGPHLIIGVPRSLIFWSGSISGILFAGSTNSQLFRRPSHFFLPLHPGGSSSSAGFPCKICWLTPPAIGGF